MVREIVESYSALVMPTVAGLDAVDAGYADEYEMARAREDCHWAIWPGALQWALIAHVCIETGVIVQRKSFSSRKLSPAVAEIGHDLCFPPSEWGWWSIRKKVCNDIVLATMRLLAAHVDSRTKNRVYKKGLSDYTTWVRTPSERSVWLWRMQRACQRGACQAHVYAH